MPADLLFVVWLFWPLIFEILFKVSIRIKEHKSKEYFLPRNEEMINVVTSHIIFLYQIRMQIEVLKWNCSFQTKKKWPLQLPFLWLKRAQARLNPFIWMWIGTMIRLLLPAVPFFEFMTLRMADLEKGSIYVAPKPKIWTTRAMMSAGINMILIFWQRLLQMGLLFCGT